VLLDFGQPAEGIIQIAYVVDDLDEAMRHYVEELSVGPWFVLRDWTPDDASYRGAPSQAPMHLAMAYNGHIQLELIQPTDDSPSVYREVLGTTGPGFHHFGVACEDYDATLARYLDRG